MYYPSSENKGADQLRGYREADLRLCFRVCRLLVFPRGGSYVISINILTASLMNKRIFNIFEYYYYRRLLQLFTVLRFHFHAGFISSDCSSTENNFTDTKTGVAVRADERTLKNSFVTSEARPLYQLFYNTVSKRIEANISWEFGMVYIGQIVPEMNS